MASEAFKIFYHDREKLSSHQILLLVLGSCVVYIVLQNLIKWLMNPKKRPPGPIGLPIVGYLPFLGSQPHKTLWELREKYGDIMSLYMGRKYTIVLSEFNVAKEVLCHSAALDRPTDFFDTFPCDGFHVSNGEKWTEQRRFCLSATRDLGLGRETWEDMIMDEVDIFTEKLSKTQGKPTDVSHALELSVSSNILSLLIGRKLNHETEEDKVELTLRFVDAALSVLGPAEPANLVPGLRKVLEFFRIKGYDKVGKITRDFSSFIRNEIIRHRTVSEFRDVHDFINTYLKETERLSKIGNTNHYFSEDMLEGNLMVLVLGASDTTSNSLGWLMKLMCQHRNIQDKVFKELKEVLGKDGKARYLEKEKIPFTFAVLLEAQRVSSIVPISSTRKLNQDISIKGYILPKGAEVVANSWGLHHDRAYWKEPEKFLPERFLTDNGTKLVKDSPSFIPFSIGRRNCPGQTIAWQEILGYFTEIVKKYEISAPEGMEIKYEVINGVVAHLKSQPLCFKKRKSDIQ